MKFTGCMRGSVGQQRLTIRRPTVVGLVIAVDL